MSTAVVKGLWSPVEELAKKLGELAHIENQLADRELFLANMSIELAAFDARYRRQVGTLYAELDEWNAKIAEARAKQDGSEATQFTASQARAQADESHAEAHGETAELDRVEPSIELRSLYREAAKRIHPDLSMDEDDRLRREGWMTELNLVYAQGDAAAMQRIVDEFESSPHSVKGMGVASDLERVIRQINQVRNRFDQIEVEITRLSESDIAKLKANAEITCNSGGDLLKKMERDLQKRVKLARRRYESMVINHE